MILLYLHVEGILEIRPSCMNRISFGRGLHTMFPNAHSNNCCIASLSTFYTVAGVVGRLGVKRGGSTAAAPTEAAAVAAAVAAAAATVAAAAHQNDDRTGSTRRLRNIRRWYSSRYKSADRDNHHLSPPRLAFSIHK